MISTQIDIESLVHMQLPPLPGSALQVASLAQDMNASARMVANAIGCDPVLAARILKAANSPLYALERRATALPMAVNTLGNSAVHSLVMMSVASDAFTKSNSRSPLSRILWGHSIAVGSASREISRVLGMRGGDESFLCGLLHDFGKILLLRHDPQGYARLHQTEEGADFLQKELEEYGYTHAQVGALVAKRWNLPNEITCAIDSHHQPSNAGQSTFMARVIDVADQMANINGFGLRDVSGLNVVESESAVALRLSEEQLAAIWQKAESALNEAMHLFS